MKRLNYHRLWRWSFNIATETFGLNWEDQVFEELLFEVGRRFTASEPDRDRVIAELREYLRPALKKRIGASGYGQLPSDGETSADRT